MTTKWTPELDRSFASAWNSGLAIELIEKRFHIGQATVERTRYRLGLLSRIKLPHWTDERAEMARALWLEGKSATEITAILRGGLTRNAVIGKLHRMGLTRESRPAGAVPLQTGRKAKARRTLSPKALRPLPVDHKPRVAKPPLTAAERSWQTPVSTPTIQREQRAHGQTALQFVEGGAGVESPNARPFLEATRGCKWPIGPAGATLYCCNPLAGGAGIGRAYCLGHSAVAVDAKQPASIRVGSAAHLARFDRMEPTRPVAANNNGSIWGLGRAA